MHIRKLLNQFTPLEADTDTHEKILLAAWIAHGTNFRIATMRSSSITTIARMRLSHSWGDGSISSSDGQLFGVQNSSLLARMGLLPLGFFARSQVHIPKCLLRNEKYVVNFS